MSSAGHVLDMIRRGQQNRALLRSRQQGFARTRRLYIDALRRNTNALPGEEIPSRVREQTRQQLRRKMRRERRRSALFIGILLACSCLGVILWAVL